MNFLTLLNLINELLLKGAILDEEILEAMRTFKRGKAQYGWVPVHPTLPSEFDPSADMIPEGYGWEKAPDGLYYLLQCPS